jgi:hypothetical protein
MCEVVKDYEKRLRMIPFVPKTLYGRKILREDGGPNVFLAFLFCDHGVVIQFLKHMGLLRSKVKCNTCRRDVTWSAQPNIPIESTWCGVKVFLGQYNRGDDYHYHLAHYTFASLCMAREYHHSYNSFVSS